MQNRLASLLLLLLLSGIARAKPSPTYYLALGDSLAQGIQPSPTGNTATDQGYAALRSLFELKDAQGQTTELTFGPNAPSGNQKQWIKTIPGKGWFAYFRIYGPGDTAFNGTWKPGDFEEVK